MDNFFDPKRIALVGASANQEKVGYALLFNLLKDKDRKIFAVSLTEKEVLGLKTFTSLSEISEQIDLAIVAVPANAVPKILEECANKKIKNVIVISAGFKEEGPESLGFELEKQITTIAEKNDISLLGPNCLGIINANKNLNATFGSSDPLSGSIGFISQSGALGTALLDRATYEGIGFSKFISLGNEASLNELDFLSYLKDDLQTSVILMYIEKVSDGKKFIETLKEITKTKPVVILKAGRSLHGKKAVSSHTGSMASDNLVFKAACKESGVILVESIREFFNLAKLLQFGIKKPLQNLVILTNGGGPSIIATDLIDFSKSLSLAELSKETKEKLKNVLPKMAAVNNPVDIIGDGQSTRYRVALDILVEEKNVDAIILIVTPQMMTDMLEIAKLVVEYKDRKSILPIFMGGRAVKPALGFLKLAGISNFNFPLDLIEALDNFASGKKKIKADNISDSPKSYSVMLPFLEMKKILKEFNIEIPGVCIKEKAEISDALEKLGSGPYAMKIMSPNIIHKTDTGAVVTNILNLNEAEKTFDLMLSKNSNADLKKDDVVLIQKMTEGKEIIIGMKRDKTFGPTILFGLGGIFTEALSDTSLSIAPVSKDEALKMFLKIRGAKILSGLRGERPINFDLLADLVVKISDLSLAHPEIEEIDLNPVIVTESGLEVVDGRVKSEK